MQNNGLERRRLPHCGERLLSETGGPGTTKAVSQRKATDLAGLTQVHHASPPKVEGRDAKGSRIAMSRWTLLGEVSFRWSTRLMIGCGAESLSGP